MRYVLLFACLLLVFPINKALGQEEEAEYTATRSQSSIIQSVPSEEVVREIALYLQSGGISAVEHFPRMVAPRVCRQRDFFIPEDIPHPRAGLVLRIEDGECVTGRPYYVHSPERHRIWPITESEALAILEAMMPPPPTSAPE